MPHQYTTIYSDYVRTPPSFSAYPKEEMIKTALDDVVRRMRVDVKDVKQDGSNLTITLTSSKPIDERYLRYLDRSDTFDGAQVLSKSPEGNEIVIGTTVRQAYFFFGTDNIGRDLLSAPWWRADFAGHRPACRCRRRRHRRALRRYGRLCRRQGR